MVSAISSSSSLMAALAAKLQQQSSTTAAANKIVFSKLDANGDGKVTADELVALASQNGAVSSSTSDKAAAVIKQADKDGDNALTSDELASFLSQLTSGGLNGSNNVQLASARDDFMTVADTDGDGTLSYAEFSSQKPDNVSDEQSQALFKSIDTDGNGSLSSDEVTAFESNRPEKGGQMKGAMVGPPPPPPSGDNSDDDTSVTSLLSKLIDTLASTNKTDDTASTTDTTNSTTDTATTEQQKLFNFFDQDNDGTVSDAELNTGVTALKTAMANYMLSVQENRAAA